MAEKKTPPAALRRGTPPGIADFDEQLWPINLLLFLFAASVGAVIVAKGDFAAGRWLANAWCHLGVLAAIVAALAWGVARLDRRVQRRMQVGVFLSLLVHLWLCMLSCNIYLSAIADRERDSPEAFEQPAPVTLPDYNWQDQATDDVADPTLETPVETALAEAEPEVERTAPAEDIKVRPPEPEQELQPVQPRAVSIERTELSAPRRADEWAGERPSRQELRVAESNEQAALPKVDEAREKTFESPIQIERTEALVDVNRPTAETALPTSQPSSRSLTRRTQAEAAPNSTAMNLPRTQTSAVSSELPRPTPERVSEAPRSAAVRSADNNVQRSSTAPSMARPMETVRQTPFATLNAVAPSSRQANSPLPTLDTKANSQIAKAAAPSDARSSAMVAQSTPAPVRKAELTETRLGEIARASATLPQRASTSTATADASTVAPSTSVTSSNPAATVRGASLDPIVSTTPSRAASRRLATSAGDETAIVESPAVAAAATSQPQSAQPDPAAISKASGGAAGLIRQQNLDIELPGVSSAATAIAAARRPREVQAMDPGSAAAPSEPAKIAKARAAAESPSASLPAENLTVADVAGSARPTDVEASSSAAVERTAAAAPRSTITAAAGSSSIDQGAPQIRSPIGEGRTSGGGEPSLSRSETAVNVAKATLTADASGAAPQLASRPANTMVAGAPEAAPAVDAVGRSANGSLPSTQSTAADAPSLDMGSPLAVASVEVRRGTESPEMNGVSSPAGPASRSPLEAAAAGNPFEPATTPQIVATSSSAGESGDGEPPSASDLVRQSTAVFPGGGVPTDAGDSNPAAGIVAIAPSAAQRADNAPSIADNGATGGLGRKPTVSAGLASDALTSENQIASSGMAAPMHGEQMAMADLGQQRQAAALPVLVRAPSDAGGLAAEASLDVGLPSRRARPESDVIHLDAGRMILERSGGRAAELRVQDVAVPGYRQRDRQLRQELARQRGGNAGSERAVEMGLDFLARHQRVDGSWSLQTFTQPGQENAAGGAMVSDTAATGLAMLAFLGAGYTHTDGKYRLVVARGLNYTLGNQRGDGDLFLPQEARSNLNVWLYSHGIAAIALSEAYGMTRDPNLKQPAQRALDFIVAAQHPTEGGWRYAPRQGSDTSVSGWQLMALKSGELSGLRVPAAAYAKVSHWLDGAQSQGDTSQYVYRPKSTRTHQNSASRVMTAEALLMRQYLGWKRDHRLMTSGADFLMGQLPEWSSGPDWQRDSYYWYYATQVMFQMGGAHWDAWNERLRPLLVDKQVQDGPLAGSWEPLGDVPDRWGREGGRIYATAMHLLMLEVYYRHLPLYQTLEPPRYIRD